MTPLSLAALTLPATLAPEFALIGLLAAFQQTQAVQAGAQQPALPTTSCATGLVDQTGGPCLQASSVATPGLLFPPPHDGGVGNASLGAATFVGGGFHNSASGTQTSVVGGAFNTATGYHSTIGGGQSNSTANYASTVSGGCANVASGYYSSVAGGAFNTASGDYASVAGGVLSAAGGLSALAAGTRARATHRGSFVWGDSQNIDKPSSRADEFSVFASGGARFFSNAAATTGVLLAPGGGTWSSASDRAAKRDIRPVDAQAVLDRVAQVPVSTWSYRTQPGVRHMGPMAQDFRAAFGLGVSETRIDTVDPDGVALAAIQGLLERIEERDAQLAAMAARIERLETLLEARTDPTSSGKPR